MNLQTINASASPEVQINENFETLDFASVYGKRPAATGGLAWGYYGGRWAGFAVAADVLTLTDAATNYIVVLRTDGIISVSTSATNWDDTQAYARAYKLTTAGGLVTATEDHRAGLHGALGPKEIIVAADAPALQGLSFTSDTGSQADSDPGAGKLRWNNATQGSATELYIDDLTADAVSLTTLWASLADAGFLYLEQADDASKWQQWKWTAAPADGTGYRKFTVTLQASGVAIDNAKTVLCNFQSDATGGVGAGGTAGRHSIPVLAAAMIPSATGGCAALATIASSANQPDITSLDFDATTQEYAQFAIPMPRSWDEGTITFKPLWSHAATTTNFGVAFGLQAVAVSNDDPIPAAYGTAQTSVDTGGTTDDLYAGPESSAITVAGTPAAEDVVFFRLSRVTADAGDDMAIDARLHGIVLYITTDAENDALPAAPAAHRYWRLDAWTTGSTILRFGEVALYSGVSDLTAGATYTVSPALSYGAAAGWKDADLGTFVGWSNYDAGYALYIDLGVGNDATLDGVKPGGGDNPNQFPTGFRLSWSDDGITYTPVGSCSGIADPGYGNWGVLQTVFV